MIGVHFRPQRSFEILIDAGCDTLVNEALTYCHHKFANGVWDLVPCTTVMGSADGTRVLLKRFGFDNEDDAVEFKLRFG